MATFLTILLAMLITAVWLLALSYADYLVAQQERALPKLGQGRRQSLPLKRLLNLPWDWLQWIISGVIVFFLSILLGVWSIWFLLILAPIGFVALAAMLWTDSQQVDQTNTILTNWQPPERQRPQLAIARLYGLRGEYKGRLLDCGHETTIGRSRKNHIVLHQPTIRDTMRGLFIPADPGLFRIRIAKRVPLLTVYLSRREP